MKPSMPMARINLEAAGGVDLHRLERSFELEVTPAGRGRYRVRIRATTARGRSFTLVRTYRTCAPKGR